MGWGVLLLRGRSPVVAGGAWAVASAIGLALSLQNGPELAVTFATPLAIGQAMVLKFVLGRGWAFSIAWGALTAGVVLAVVMASGMALIAIFALVIAQAVLQFFTGIEPFSLDWLDPIGRAALAPLPIAPAVVGLVQAALLRTATSARLGFAWLSLTVISAATGLGVALALTRGGVSSLTPSLLAVCCLPYAVLTGVFWSVAVDRSFLREPDRSEREVRAVSNDATGNGQGAASRQRASSLVPEIACSGDTTGQETAALRSFHSLPADEQEEYRAIWGEAAAERWAAERAGQAGGRKQ